MLLKGQFMKICSLDISHLQESRENITKNPEKNSVADPESTSHMVNSLKKIINMHRLKAVLNNRNEITMIGSLWGKLKGFYKRDKSLYPIMCTDTVYIPDLSPNILA